MAERKTLRTIGRILANAERVRDISRAAYEIRAELIPLALESAITEAQFYRVSSLLSPQARSPLWEKYLGLICLLPH